MPGGKRVLVGFLSTLAWPLLLMALFVTSANLIVNNLNHVGDFAATVVKEVSTNPHTLDSLIDEFTKSAEPKLAKEIEKNRARIERTIALLGSSSEFRELISSTLSQISQAALSGASSVEVDFVPLTTLVATKVNEAAKSKVINTKILTDIQPTSIDLSKQSRTITKVKDSLHQALLIWILWLILLIGLFLLIGRRVMQIYGAHLISIGIVGLVLRFLALALAQSSITSAGGVHYVEQVVPKVLETLLSPIMTLSVVALVLGAALIAIGQFVKDRPVLQRSGV